MHIVIIGNGISGITAARWVRKLSDHHITVISAESDYFYSRTALMYIYMGHMKEEDTRPYEKNFWRKNRINLLRGKVESVDFNNKKLHISNPSPVMNTRAEPQSEMHYDRLVIATGSSPNKFGWPGQDLEGVRGLYTLQDLAYMEQHSEGLQHAVIVGGGLIGIEMAEMFHSRHIPVTMLVRENEYWNNALPKEEAQMIGRHIRENGIDLRLATELQEIVDDGTGKACAVITNKGERIDCGYVGLTAGVHPNVGFLRDTALEIGRGIKVDKYLKTNIPDVYAIGDCAEQREPQAGRRPVEAIWYTGRMMGEVAAYNICDKPVWYDPGIWFNSAKFFDIEYQVYGSVLAKAPAHHAALYWEHSNGKKSIRLVYDKDEGHILGFNLMGIRYRHEVCEKWIDQKTPLREVLQHLGLANFDPEFFKEYESDLIAQYNQNAEEPIALKRKRGLAAVLDFLRR